MPDAWFHLLANEANNRVISTIIDFIQLLGIIIPLIVGAITYVIRSRETANQEMFNFFVNWLSPDRQDRRVRYRKILSQPIDMEKFFSNEFIEDRGIISQKLNEDELLAIYVMADPKKERAAKKFARAIIVDDWKFAESVVHKIRERASNPNLYANLEELVNRWSLQH